MAWITPKTNWTANDYYNFSDLNKVENNIQEIETLINSYSNIAPLTSITNRTNTYIEYFDSLQRIESNILALAQATFIPINWITPKTNWQSVIDAFGFVDANRLESNLYELYTMINKIKEYFLYSGKPNAICGNDNTIL